MSDYQIADSNDLVQCPYEKSHMITVKRLQYHLIKCRKNHKGSQEYGVCPYNATHEMPKPELRHHMTICPDRAMVEKTLRYETTRNDESGDILKGCTDVPAYNTIEFSTGENWDLEIPSEPKMGVDPSFFENQTRRSLAGMTPLEKRQFHSSIVPDINDIYYREQHVPVGMKANKKSKKQQESKEHPPLKKSQTEDQGESQSRMPKQPSSVFQYSLTMAGVGRGGGAIPIQSPSTINPIYQQPLPHGLQINSNNSSKSLHTDPPESIKKYLFFPGDRERNRAHRRKFNTVRLDEQNLSDASVESGEDQTASRQRRGIGRGRVSLSHRQANSRPVAPPTSNLASTGIGRGDRLQNSFCDMNHITPPVKTPWASYLTEGVKKEEDFPALGNSSVTNDDFPALGGNNRGNGDTMNKMMNGSTRSTHGTSDAVYDNEIGGGDGTSNHNDVLENAKKKGKAIRKKLGAISKLEDKQEKGGQLTQEELNKISRRKGLEEELKSLSLS